MVQIKDGSRLSERNLMLVLSVCVIVSIIGSVLMMGLTSQDGGYSAMFKAAAAQAGFGSVAIGNVIVGTLAMNLLVWIGVLMIGLLSWAGRSFGRTAPRQELDVAPKTTSVELSVS